MKQLTVISGKGGTGKTTITAAFATLSDSHVIADCDVDAADLHLILHPTTEKSEEFYGGKIAVIDSDKCQQCDECIKVCRFDAIEDYVVDPISCEGCGVCVQACPEGAISMEKHLNGHWFISKTRSGYMTHAKLGIAEENSGKLVTLVRQQAKVIAERENKEYVIIDGPPGIGCPVIAAISGVDLLLAVTEPTLSGIHDLERVVGVAKHFNVPVTVCINKYDINTENTTKIEEFCLKNGLEVAGKVLYDPGVTKAMVNKQSVIEYPCGEVTEEIKRIWGKVDLKLKSL
ncbi:MAG: 4Fe-4S binding protein [Proteobacteria bacterium]|nr:4Fe-4S binding protein [Pseudomonadota bacterium]